MRHGFMAVLVSLSAALVACGSDERSGTVDEPDGSGGSVDGPDGGGGITEGVGGATGGSVGVGGNPAGNVTSERTVDFPEWI